MSVLRDFDNYLDELNSYPNHRGIVERLIAHNQKTQGSNNKPWERLLRYDIDVHLWLDLTHNQIQKHIQDNYVFPEGARTGFNQRVLAQFSLLHRDFRRWTFKLPLQNLLKGWGDANDGYECYVHTIKYASSADDIDGTSASDKKVKEMHYVGITKRHWLQRLEEHFSEIRRGDNKLFHRKWRESLAGQYIVYISELMLLNISKEAAMEWEERYVDKWSLVPKGFNMIPGGHKGIRFLHKHRIIDRLDISLEERERAIANYVRQNPRKGIPNPFMSQYWKNDDFYLRVIGARDKTLTPDQVRQIRALAEMGWSIPQITAEVKALNETQVRKVIAGITYGRIH